MRILIVDDEQAITDALMEVLLEENYEVCVGHNAAEFLLHAREWKPDLVLLDISMPGEMSGLDALRVLRRESDVPVIFVTGKSADVDKVLGLEYADDYLVKPFSNIELLARVRAVLRRAAPRRAADETANRIEVGDLCIDLGTHEVTFAGRLLALTVIEFRILTTLAARPVHVFQRDFLIASVWGEDTFITPHALDVHISSLRRKLEPDPSNPVHVQTVRGVGFRYMA